MNFTEIIGNEIPDEAHAGEFTGFDGLTLRYGMFKADAGASRGTICLFGGRSEPIEKYFESIKKWQQRGFCVVMMDWRGQGLSDRLTTDRRRGHVISFGQYVQDVDVLLQKIVKPNCPAPYNAVAHSTGGNILTQYAASSAGQDIFEKMVLISPFYAFDIGGIKATIIKIVAGAMSGLGIGTLKATFLEGGPKELKVFDPNNLISSDQNRMEREQDIIKANLDLALGAPTFGWLNAAFKAITKVNNPKLIAAVKTPILMVVGLNDHLVSQPAMLDVADKLPDCHVVKIADGRHELLMENDDIIDQTWVAMDEFLLVD
ncbi:MAG: alpha/beta hydrolase [Rhizobiales bacterium]|nr:alpha/beta hydrolase [Hyphomicrobiales bacterium]NRB14735.1 alpha/beta hydrolase [Hyphomicrobiales bacterium]